MSEIELYSKMENPMDAIERAGEFFAKSGMFGCDRKEQGSVLAMVCMAEKKSPTEIMRTYHLVDGQLSKKALAALGEFRQKGGRHKWIETGDEEVKDEDSRRAVGEFTPPDGDSITVSFSITQAKRQGLSFKPNSNWVKTPGNMLRARVISNAIGMLMPEIFAGEMEMGGAPAPVSNKPLLQEEKEPKPKKKKAEEKKPDPQPETKPTEAEPFKAEADDKGLTGDTQNALAQAIEGEKGSMEDVFAYLQAKEWIKDHLRDLSVPRAQKIISKPKGFLKLVAAYLADKKGGE